MGITWRIAELQDNDSIDRWIRVVETIVPRLVLPVHDGTGKLLTRVKRSVTVEEIDVADILAETRLLRYHPISYEDAESYLDGSVELFVPDTQQKPRKLPEGFEPGNVARSAGVLLGQARTSPLAIQLRAAARLALHHHLAIKIWY